MLNVSSSVSGRIVTSLKVAALVTVLGSLVLAAEERLAAQISPEQSVTVATAPAIPASTADLVGQQAPTDYFPARFPAPSGQAADQPPTF
jgi:hypothetical protein